jgi:integrase
MALTDTKIKSAKAKEKRYIIADSDGLYIEIMQSGKKYFRYRPRSNGKDERVTIGEYPIFSLQEARQERDQLAGLVARGISPNEHKRTEKLKSDKADTFEEVAMEWVAKKRKYWSPEYYEQRLWLLEVELLPAFGKKKIALVESSDLLGVMTRCEERDAKTTAIQARSVTSQIMCYAISRLKAKYDIAAPLRGAIIRDQTRHATAHTPETMIEMYWRIDNTSTATKQTKTAIKLLAMLFTRTTELIAAKKTEIDLDQMLWVIPKERMKKRRAHIVPLSPQAVLLFSELLNNPFNHTEYLFPSHTRTSKGNKKSLFMNKLTMNNAFVAMGFDPIFITGHDFRATAFTHLLEAGYSKDIVDAQLAHAKKSKTDAAYDHAVYLPQRTEIMRKWSDQLDEWQELAKIKTFSDYE